MGDGIDQVRPVQRVEVELVHPIGLQQAHLLGGDHGRDHAPGLGVLVQAFVQLAHPGRHAGAAHGREARRLGVVGHRHDAGHDRHGDAGLGAAVQELQVDPGVEEVLGDRALTIRTAWVYDATGKNFLRTMLRLMHERGAVKVVADQMGTPTSSHSLADILWRCALNTKLGGIYHWTDAGVASWYDFAVAIAEEAVAVGLLKQLPVITPIATHEYPTPAHRPAFSVLDKSATYAALNAVPVHWRVRLREVMARVEL